MHGFTFANTEKWSKKWSKVSYYLVFLFFLNMSKHILLWVLRKHAPTHSHSLWPTSIHSHPLPLTPTYSHQLPPTPTYSHLLPPTPTHFHIFPSTRTHSHPLPLIFYPLTHMFNYSHPLPLTFSPLLLVLNPPPSMCSLSHPFPVHIQILSPNPAHNSPFQPIFSPCVLRAHTNFNVNLFCLLFSGFFRKQLITLGLTTTFVYFQ